MMKKKKETKGTRFKRLLKMLIKVSIMFIVMTGLILINKKFLNNADGYEKNGQIKSLEIVEATGSNVYSN